jgi:hypothetical protein
MRHAIPRSLRQRRNNHGKQRKRQERSPEPAQTAKAATLSACDRLVAAGVTFVAVHFDGYGDDGTTEDVKCYDSEWYAWGEHEPLKYDPSIRTAQEIRSVPADVGAGQKSPYNKEGRLCSPG